MPAAPRRASGSPCSPARRAATLARHTDGRHIAVIEYEVVLGAFEMLGGEFEIFFSYRPRRFVDGVAGDHGTAARKGAGTPIKLVGIAGDDVDVGHVDAELVGDDLGEAVKCPCPWVPIPVATLTLPFACT